VNNIPAIVQFSQQPVVSLSQKERVGIRPVFGQFKEHFNIDQSGQKEVTF
jgi:hypothetical protein